MKRILKTMSTIALILFIVFIGVSMNGCISYTKYHIIVDSNVPESDITVNVKLDRDVDVDASVTSDTGIKSLFKNLL